MRTAAPTDASILGRVWRLPHVPALTASVFMLGFGLSLALPYLSLFGVKGVGMTPLQLGIFLTLNAVSAVLISTRLARWSDRWPRRKPLVLLTMVAGAAAYLLLSSVRTYPGVILTGLVFMGTAAAAFPQVFAFARVRLSDAPQDLPERAVTVLRSVFSLAWVAGPGLGAAALAQWGFQGVFLATAACFVLAALPLLTVPERVVLTRPRAATPAPSPEAALAAPKAAGRGVWWVALAFVLYAASMSMGMTMFPLFITETLRGTEGQVGFLVGLCALLEIPVMLALVTLRGLPTTEKLVKGAFLLFALHFALIYCANGLALLVTTQAIRAAVLAVTAGLGMLYFQELMPGRFAAATTMFANTSAVGSMLAGIVSGAAAQWFGYRAVFLLCAALTLGGWLVMQLVVKRVKG